MISSIYLEFPGGPSATVTCIGDPPCVPMLELIRIHASQFKRTAVVRRFGDTSFKATAAETKTLKEAGAVASRSHDIRLVQIVALGAGVVATVNADADDAADKDAGADQNGYTVDDLIIHEGMDQHESESIELPVSLPQHVQVSADCAGSALNVHSNALAEDPTGHNAHEHSIASSIHTHWQSTSVAVHAQSTTVSRRSVKDPNISVDTVLASLHLQPSASLPPAQRWALALVRHCALVHVSAPQTYNVLRAAFGLVLFGETGKCKGTAKTICRDIDEDLRCGLFACVAVKTGGRRTGNARFALQCVEWTKWLEIAEEEGFEEVSPLGTPPPLPVEEE
jgi:hypothetical protein